MPTLDQAFDSFDSQSIDQGRKQTSPELKSLDKAMSDFDLDMRKRAASIGSVASQSDPETYARARRLGSELNIPAEVAERNMPLIERSVLAKRIAETYDSSPVLTKHMSGAEFAKLVHDDINSVAELERTAKDILLKTQGFAAASKFSRATADLESYGQFDRTMSNLQVWGPPERTAGDIGTTLGRTLASSPYLMSQGITGAAAAVTDTFAPLLDLALPGEPIGAVGDWLRNIAGRQAMTADYVAGDRSNAGFIERGVISGVESLGINLPPLIIGMLTGQPEIALSVMSTVTGGQEYLKAKEQGLTTPQAFTYAAAQAAVEYGTEKIPVSRLFKDLREGTGLLKTALVNQVQEQFGEQVATALQDLNEWSVLNPDKPFSAYLDERPEAAAQTALATLVGSGGQVVVMKSLESAANLLSSREQKAQHAQETLAAMQQLHKVAQATKLAERAPDVMQKFMQEVENQYGETPTEVWLDAKLFQQATEAAGLSPEQVSLTAAEQLGEALVTGADVRIPLSEWAMMAGRGQISEELLGDIKLDSDGMTWNEAQVFQQQYEQELTDEAEKILQQRQADEVFSQSAANVETAILDQLNSAGRYTPEVNQNYAQLASAYYITRANDLGVTPEELWQQIPLQVIDTEVSGGFEMDQRQIQTNTPEFQNWFGDSKVVDENGAPLVVYHGTQDQEGFDTFSPRGSFGGWNHFGSWFTSNADLASDLYAKLPHGNGHGGTYPVYLSIKNPWETTWKEMLRVFRFKTDNDLMSESAASQIKEYLKLSNKDGVIIKDFDGDGEMQDMYIALDPSQIKSAIGNRGTFDPNDPNILNQEVGPQLSALHNLASENLIFADEMGGLAAPSIGVVTGDMGIEGYGDITLIGTKDLADPSSVEVYDADAYTSTFPKPEYKTAKVKDADALVSEIRPWVELYQGDGYDSTINEVFDNTYNNARPDRAIEAMLKSEAVRAWFLYEKTGVKTRPVKKAAHLRYDFSAHPDIVEFFKSLPDEVESKGVDSEEAVKARKDLATILKRVVTEKYTREGDTKLATMMLDRMVDSESGEVPFGIYESLRTDQKNVGKKVVDTRAVSEKLDKKLKGKEAEFKQWITDKVMPMHGEPFLKLRGKKVDYSLDNIVDYMTHNGVHAKEETMTFGPGKARAAAATRFDDLTWMRNAAEAAIKDPASIKESREAADKMLEDYRNAVIDHYTYKDWKGNIDTWSALDDSMKALAKWAKTRLKYGSKSALKRALTSEGFKGVPDSAIELGVKAGEAMLEAPVPYFEAKPNRAVGLDEFAGAVVPTDVDKKVVDILKKHNIDFIKYGARYDEEARRKAVVKLRKRLAKKGQDVLFQNRPDIEPIELQDEGDIAKVQTGQPVTFYFTHNTESATGIFGFPDKESPYGRGYEPSARYVSVASKERAENAYGKFIGGKLTFINPLVIPNDGLQWKKTLSEQYGGKVGKELSKALIADGFDGVITTEERYITETIDLTTFDEAKALYQRKPTTKARGSYEPTSRTISLLKDANSSTFIHELGHHFLEMDAAFASDPNAPEKLRRDFDTLLGWVGVEPTPEETRIDVWNRLPFEEKRSYHEKFARGFEAYTREGKAPSLTLLDTFRRFGEWLKRVYRSLTQLNVELTDEVREVMNRMLASEEQIRAAKAAQSYAPLFETREQAGMTDAEWNDYQRSNKQADDEAIEDMQSRSVRDMRWMSNAKSREIKKLQKQAAGLRKLARIEARHEIMQEPVYQAWTFLTASIDKVQKKPKVKKLKGVDPENDSLFIAIAKLGGLNRDAVISSWGLDQADIPKAPIFGKPLLRAKDGGKTIDEMAEALAQDGYLELDADGKWDLHDFEDRFFAELRGDEQFALLGFDSEMKRQIEERFGSEEQQLIDIANMPAGRLSLTELKDVYGDEADAAWRKIQRMARSDGLPLDAVADFFGFSSGDEMVQALIAAPELNEQIGGLADKIMLERYAELSDDESIERTAERVIRNDVRARIMATEMKYAGKLPGDARAIAAAAKTAAEKSIARKRIRDIRPGQFTSAEARAGRAIDKLRGKDTGQLFDELRNRLLANRMARAAMDALVEVERDVKYLKKFDKGSVRQKLDPTYVDQIDQLLEKFELKRVTNKQLDKRESLARWIEKQKAFGLEPAIDDDLLELSQVTNYRSMTVDEFRSLVDAVKNIEHLGRLKNKLLTAKDKRAFNAAMDEISGSINGNAKRTLKVAIERNGLVARLKKGGKEFFAMHRKLANVIRTMDGLKDGGVFWDYLIKPMNAAGDHEAVLREQATMALTELFKPVLATGKMRRKVFIPEIDASLSREARIVIALNTGNDGNLQRLLDGDHWSEPQLQAVLDTLTQEDWDFVQSVWDYLETMRPAVAEHQRQLTGIEPQWLESRVVHTKFGNYRGGYFPAKYDTDRSTRSLSDEAASNVSDLWRAKRGQPSARASFTKERANKVINRPLRKDFGVLFQHVNEVAHRLAWQPWLIDARRILNDSRIDGAIRDHYGPEIIQLMRDAFEDIAAGDIPAQNTFEHGINFLRTGVTVAGLGWNLGTAMLQPLGLTQSWVRIGPKWVAKGMSRWLGDAARMQSSAKWIYDRSDFMRLRDKTLQREINEIRNTIDKKNLSMLEVSYFYLIQKMQKVADIPTWLGAYEKAMANGETEDRAVAMADQAVIDAQGGGQIKDLAAIQRGSPLMKLWTNFYSFFSTTFNLSLEVVGRTEFNKPGSVGLMAVDFLMLYTIPTILGMLIKDSLRGGGDDDDELAEKIVREQLSYMMGMMVGLREVASAVQGFSGYNGPGGLRFFSELNKLYKQVEQGEVDEALLKSANNTAGILFHYPAGQVQRTGEGIYALSTGEVDNPGVLVTGPPRD